MSVLTLLLATALAALPRMPDLPPRTDEPHAQVRAGKEVEIMLDLKLPKGWRLHPDQRFVYRIAQTAGAVKVDETTRKGYLAKPRFPIKVPFTPPEGKCEVLLQVAFYYCPKDSLEGCKAFSRYYFFPLLGAPAAKPRKLPLEVRPEP